MFSVGAEQQKNNHLIICGNCWKVLPGQKHTQEVGGGTKTGENQRLSCFCIKEQTWHQTRIQYYGQAAHQMGAVAHPPLYLCLSLPAFIPSFATAWVCFLSKTRLIFPDWTAPPENAQIKLGILMWTEHNFSFQLFHWFSHCLLSLISFLPFIFLFVFPGSLSAAWNTG